MLMLPLAWTTCGKKQHEQAEEGLQETIPKPCGNTNGGTYSSAGWRKSIQQKLPR